MRVAAIDIGTNTVLLLIAEVGLGGGLVPIVDRAEITRLGQGVDRARVLAPEAVERTLACLSDYAAVIADSGVDRVDVVGTSAMRDAANGAGFVERAAAILGIAPRVVTGEEEASLAFAGGLYGLGLEGEVVAFDVGGGSTEIIRGHLAAGRVEVRSRVSLDVGSVRLFERHIKSDPPSPTEMAVVRAFVLDQLLGIGPAPSGLPLVGMAGTVTSLAAVARGIDPYDGTKIHGMRLSARELAETARRLTELPSAERRKVPGLEPKRADVIPVGGAIVEAIVGWSQSREVVVSDRGVRWGLALDLSSTFSPPKAGARQTKGS